MPATIDACYCL